jgi:5-methylcytosine-specific restriction endonuclease McrA
MSSLRKPVLVLNKVWSPIRVIPTIRAFKLLFADKASVVNTDTYFTYNWDEWVKIPTTEDDNIVKSVHFDIKVPEVIVLLKYDKTHKKNVRLTKKNIFIRDNYHCQYTGKQISRKEADIDHVIPRSKGGKNSWDNMVVCSKSINRKKGDKTPKEAGLKLIKTPSKPNYDQLMIDPKMNIPESWKKFIR